MWSYVNVDTPGILIQHTKSGVLSSLSRSLVEREPKSMSCVVDKGHVEGAEMHSLADN